MSKDKQRDWESPEFIEYDQDERQTTAACNPSCVPYCVPSCSPSVMVCYPSQVG